MITSAHPHVRLRAHAALALCGMLAATAFGLLGAAPAPASSARTARTGIVRSSCTLKRGKRSRSRGHGVRACVKTRARVFTHGTPAAPVGAAAPVEVTSVAPTGPAPAARVTRPAPQPTPPAATEPATSPTESDPPAIEPPAQPGESGTLPWPSGGVTTDPIDPRFLTAVPFGARSFWLQPWRAYLDTLPSSRLLESLGINFNVTANTAEDTAHLLQDSGFRYARIGINWSALTYSDPTVFSNDTTIRARLQALKRHGLRPLILLDANSLAPAPAKQVTLVTTAPALAGARTVALSAASAAAVVPGKTGFNKLSFGGNPDILITAVSAAGVATLSRPLLSPLPAGEHAGATLLYAPFARPVLGDGSPNPAFRETLRGWLAYVAAVNREATSVLGPGGYDLEIWNELSFGSQFLNAEHYYGGPEGPCPEKLTAEEVLPEECEAEPGAPEEPAGKKTVNKEINTALLNETVAYVRAPANGIPASVAITDGFASQSPFPSGANAPVGLTALSKHPYGRLKVFPAASIVNGIRPINALGQHDWIAKSESFAPLYVPTYDSLFPEFPLAVTSTQTLVRDVAPMTTEIYGFPHGREVGPSGGKPLQKWVTEYNLGSAKAVPVGPDGVTPQPAATLTSADKAHFEAKALLRSLVAMVNKGISREYFYAATNAGDLSMISPDFMSAAVANPTSYPGDALGGETMSAFHSLLAQFQGPGPGPAGARQLQLVSIAQDGNHAQFTGDGTAAHPTLYDREVLAVLPFQSSPTRFTIPVYVMTRDLLTLYKPEAPSSDIHRFDLPDETFRITLANLPTTSKPPTISAYDPLRNETTPAKLISRTGENATIELAATDYPRILTIDYSS